MKEIKNYPKVSIITLNWNGLEDTIECLESLKKITYPNYEVVVVDNGSVGNDTDILYERYGEYIKLIRNDENLGFTGGNNVALQYLLIDSDADYFLLLNNDTVVDPEFLTEMVMVAETDASIGIAGCKTYFYDDPKRLQVVCEKINMYKGQPIRVGFNESDNGQYEDIKSVDYVQGSCFLIRRNIVENIGLLDEDYFTYWEEADYCYRAKKAGYKTIYVPKSHIWHKESISISHVSPLTEYYMARNNFLFMSRYANKKQIISFIVWYSFRKAILYSGVLVFIYKDTKRLKSFLKGSKDGVLLLFQTFKK